MSFGKVVTRLKLKVTISMLQYIIYCRKSSESEERQVLSIESQIKELKELTQRLRLNVSEILTEAQSAKYPGRPIFNDMMKKIYAGQVKGVISWKLDRLARNPIDGSALVWALDQGKITEIVTPYGTFLNDSNSKFLMQLEFGMAKKYVDDLSDNVKRGNRAKLERGWIPGPPPLGYLNDPKEKIVIKDPDRFSLIRKIWDLLLEGVPISKIQKIANSDWGLRTRPYKKLGNKPLSLSAFYKIFSNPFYYGLIQRKEGIFQGKHGPMITEEEYWKAQEVLGRRGRPRPKNHHFAFTGLIRCGECGSMITAEEKVNRFGSHYTYYHCTKKDKNHICRQRCINLTDLEKQILDYLSRIHVPERLLALAMEYLKDEEKEESKSYDDIQRSLQKAFTDCQRKLENLNQMRLNDLIDDEEYLKEKKRLLDEKIRLEEIPQNQNGKNPIELTGKILAFAHQAKDRFKKASLDGKRTLLQQLGSNLFLKDKKLIIQAEKPFLILEEGVKKANQEIGRIEPLKNGPIDPKNGLPFSMIQQWCAVVHDVRTFYREKEIS